MTDEPDQRTIRLRSTIGQIEHAMLAGNWDRVVAATKNGFAEWTGIDTRPENPRSVTLMDIGVPLRTCNALERVGIVTLGELLAHRQRLAAVTGLGETMRSEMLFQVVDWLTPESA